MGNSLSRTIFNIEENKYLDGIVEAAIKCEEINGYIKEFGWYLTPFFYQDQYNRIKTLKDNNCGSNESIAKVFKDTLFEPRILAIYMEAFYKKLPYIKDFSFLIDHGIILYLQSDYPGAINILIPVIEGVIRGYLETQGITNPKFSHLKESFSIMRKNIEEVHKNRYINAGLGELDYNPLIRKFDIYLTKWFSFIEDFIANGLYLNTKDGKTIDYLNRHSILHGMTNYHYYSFRNATKIYISIQYLSWIFIEMTNEFSMVPDIKESDYQTRHLVYQEIKNFSWDKLNELKYQIYKTHSTFDCDKFFN